MPPLFAAAIVVLLEALCFTLALPVFSYYTQELGGDGLWLGLMFALMSLPKVVTNPLWGKFSDRFGRRPTLAINTLGTLTASVGWALAPELGGLALPALGWLLISRLLVGVFGGQAALANAIAADVSPPEKRAASMGVLGAAFALALSFGPLASGLLATHISYAQLGWIMCVCQLTSIAIITFVLPETRKAPANGAAAVSTAPTVAQQRRLLARREVLVLLVVIAMIMLGVAHINTTFALIAEHTYKFSASHTGYAFAVFGIIAAIVQGGIVRRLTPRWGEYRPLVAGVVASVAGFGLLACAPPLPGFWTAIALMAIGMALVSPCLVGLLSRRVEAARQGSLMGLHQSVNAIGRAGGAVVGGFLYEAFTPNGPTAPCLSAAVFIAGALVVLHVSGLATEVPPTVVTD